MIHVRRLGSHFDSTAWKIGTLPSGSIMKNSVTAAVAISCQFMALLGLLLGRIRILLDDRGQPSPVRLPPIVQPLPSDASAHFWRNISSVML